MVPASLERREPAPSDARIKRAERGRKRRKKERMRKEGKEIEVPQRAVEDQRLRSQRNALLAEAGRRAGGEGREEAAARVSASPTTVPAPGKGAQTGTSHFALSRPSLTQSRSPKLDNVEAYFAMSRSKLQFHMLSLGGRHVRKATADPAMVGDINVSQEELEQRHTPPEIKDARFGYGLMMESMTGYAFAELCMQQAMSPSGAWQELEKYYMPETIAATRRLSRVFETIRMTKG